MFGIFLLFAVTMMQVYVFRRFSTVPFVKKRIPGKFIIMGGLFFWACFFFSRIFGDNGIGSLAGILEFISMTWMAMLFLIDLVTGFGYLLRRYVPSARGLAFIAGLLLSVIALVQGLRPPVVQNYSIEASGLRNELDGTTIVAISDMHLGSLINTKWLKARIDQVSKLKPDLIVLPGNISEGHGSPDETLLPVLNRFSAPFGVWAVLGNHGFHSHREAIKVWFEGIQFLG